MITKPWERPIIDWPSSRTSSAHRDSVKHLYERALSYFLMAGDTAACALVYDDLGFYPMAENDFATAIAFSEKGLTCLKDTTDELYHRSAAMIESSLNNYYSWSGRPEGRAARFVVHTSRTAEPRLPDDGALQHTIGRCVLQGA